jgi:hypothetical protein
MSLSSNFLSFGLYYKILAFSVTVTSNSVELLLILVLDFYEKKQLD